MCWWQFIITTNDFSIRIRKYNQTTTETVVFVYLYLSVTSKKKLSRKARRYFSFKTTQWSRPFILNEFFFRICFLFILFHQRILRHTTHIPLKFVIFPEILLFKYLKFAPHTSIESIIMNRKDEPPKIVSADVFRG